MRNVSKGKVCISVNGMWPRGNSFRLVEWETVAHLGKGQSSFFALLGGGVRCSHFKSFRSDSIQFNQSTSILG